MWLGDHRQTPGGLRKSEAARRFRQKLLKRPVALRGDTALFQPNQLSKVVSRYLTGTTAAPAYPVLQLLQTSTQQELEDRTRMVENGCTRATRGVTGVDGWKCVPGGSGYFVAQPTSI